MDCRTALAKRARLRPRGEALRRRILARPRAGRYRAELRPQALEKPEFAEERNLDFPSPGFEFSSQMISIFPPLALKILPRTLSNTRASRGTAPLPLAFIELRAAGEAPFSAREPPAVLRCVNAAGAEAGSGFVPPWGVRSVRAAPQIYASNQEKNCPAVPPEAYYASNPGSSCRGGAWGMFRQRREGLREGSDARQEGRLVIEDDEEDSRNYLVVCNSEEQYSIWPSHKPNSARMAIRGKGSPKGGVPEAHRKRLDRHEASKFA